MKITTRESYGVLVVEIGGRLDSTTAGDCRDEMDQIVKSGNQKIVVNLKELEYISSVGLPLLLNAGQLAQASGGQIKFCQPTDLVKHTLQVSGFHSLLNVYDSEDEAIKSF